MIVAKHPQTPVFGARAAAMPFRPVFAVSPERGRAMLSGLGDDTTADAGTIFGFDPASLNLGFGSGMGAALLMAGAAVVLFAVMGSPAKERRSKLSDERKRHSKAMADIRAEYGRFGRRSRKSAKPSE